MDVLKIIIIWICKFFYYIFWGALQLVSFVFKMVFYIIEEIWNFIIQDSKVRRTASGSRDQRFKASWELDKKENSIGCMVFIIVLIVLMIKDCSKNKDKDPNTNQPNTVVIDNAKKRNNSKSKPQLYNDHNKNQETIIGDTTLSNTVEICGKEDDEDNNKSNTHNDSIVSSDGGH